MKQILVLSILFGTFISCYSQKYKDFKMVKDSLTVTFQDSVEIENGHEEKVKIYFEGSFPKLIWEAFLIAFDQSSLSSLHKSWASAPAGQQRPDEKELIRRTQHNDTSGFRGLAGVLAVTAQYKLKKSTIIYALAKTINFLV